MKFNKNFKNWEKNFFGGVWKIINLYKKMIDMIIYMLNRLFLNKELI